MMSSVLQQCGAIPDIVFSVAYVKNNGSPRTEDVCELFRNKGLDVRETVYDDPFRIMHRGLSRNDMLGKATCDWILFADADMAYSPRFFEDLAGKLESDLKSERRCITARRVSLDKDYCCNAIDGLSDYPCVVARAGELESWPVRKMSNANGSGYFQLARVDAIKERFGCEYLDPQRVERDFSWRFKSDRMFRHKVGGIFKIECLPQYHLNHHLRVRSDAEAEIQR